MSRACEYVCGILSVFTRYSPFSVFLSPGGRFCRVRARAETKEGRTAGEFTGKGGRRVNRRGAADARIKLGGESSERRPSISPERLLPSRANERFRRPRSRRLGLDQLLRERLIDCKCEKPGVLYVASGAEPIAAPRARITLPTARKRSAEFPVGETLLG